MGVFGGISAAPGVMNLLKFFRELEMDIHPEFYQAVPVSASACKPERSDQAYFQIREGEKITSRVFCHFFFISGHLRGFAFSSKSSRERKRG